MRLLLVVPSMASTGEAVTALGLGRQMLGRGGAVDVLVSASAARIFNGSRLVVTELGGHLATNQHRWAQVLGRHPDIIVFADYPLLHLSSGIAPLADDRWCRSLANVAAALWTFDHLGYAQGEATVFFGPPHIGDLVERLPALPPGMRVLRPCPLGEPGTVPERVGEAVRCDGGTKVCAAETREAVRRRYLGERDGVLVVHAVSAWAETFAAAWDLPHYTLLHEVLAGYLADLPCPVTLVSVNGSGTLLGPGRGNLRIVNMAGLDPPRYDALIGSADLLMTDNAISSSLGKAVCAEVPAVALRNSLTLRELLAAGSEDMCRVVQAIERRRLGGVFPWEVFPIWSRADLERLGIFHGNRIMEAIEQLELFGGIATRERLAALLLDPRVRAAVRARQHAYRVAVEALPDAATVVGSS